MIKFNRNADKVVIIAPAFACKDSEGNIDKKKSLLRLKSTIDLFETNGFYCSYNKKIFMGDILGYFAAPKEERQRQLIDAIRDPAVKIISAFRGGYGCSEIVFDCLDFKPSSPKILIGFSDITVLHFLFAQHYNFPSIHGIVSPDCAEMMPHLMSVLSGQDVSFNLHSINVSSNDNISGETIGGNLTLICNMIGTKLHPNLKDKILFIEDISEKGYQVHRHLLHMKNAGLFESVKAVIFADFTESDAHIDQTIKTFSSVYLSNIPVYRTTGIGHSKINYPLAIGGRSKITGNKLVVSSPFELI